MESARPREEPDPGVRDFFLRFLETEGIVAKIRNSRVYSARLNAAWQERLKRKTIRFTFHRDVACDHADVELVAFGSPLFETCVGVIQGSPRWTKLFVPVRHRWSRGTCMKHFEFLNFAPELTVSKATYMCYLTFNFVLSFSGVEVGKELVRLCFNPFSDKVTHSPPREFETASLLRERERSIPIHLTNEKLERVFNRCVGVLKTDLRNGLAKLEEVSRRALDEESGRLSRYYQDLISEEKERSFRLTGQQRAYRDSVGERTHELKLEWERRLALEAERLLPTVSIGLVGIELFGVPARSVLIGVAGRGDVKAMMTYFDQSSGLCAEARCPVCKRKSSSFAFVEKGNRIVCKSCFV